ncbi:MAG: histidine phosphatase family protein [Acidimicrobiales bacterium]
MRPAEVLAVRHGETEWSASGRHTSRTDMPLTEDGRAQAAQLGARLAARTFALVLSSPRARALETCHLAGLGERVQVDDDLAEWDYGEYEGMTTEEIRATRPGWWMWSDGYPGGEAAADVSRRADRVIARCREAEGDAAVFAHGHILRVFGARWIDQPVALGAALSLSTASVCVLGWERDVAAITSWNDTSHLQL